MASTPPFPLRRWTLVFCLGLVPVAVPAAPAPGWDCRQAADTGQWTCRNAGSGRSGLGAARSGAAAAPATLSDADEGTTRGLRSGSSLPAPPPDIPFEEPPKPPPRPIPPAAPGAAAASSSVAGWNCRPGAADEDEEAGWECAHGSAEAGGKTGEDWKESGTFTAEDEQRFQTLMGQFSVNPWKNACLNSRWMPPLAEFQVSARDRAARDTAPTDINANYFEMFGNEVINFSGGAVMIRADQKISGDFLNRNTANETLTARGNVVYSEKGLAMASDSGFLRTKTSQGVFRNAQILFPAVPSRGIARLATLDSSSRSRYEQFSYTACPPGNDDWILHASRVKIDKEQGEGTASHAWMEFKGVPFLYLPYLTFPTDSRRKSGFLSPSFGSGTQSVFSIQLPYYFNLESNYDYTFTPRYLTEHGVQLKNEFRYLTEITRGRINADVVPDDLQAGPASSNSQNVRIPVTRGQVGILNDTRFSDRLTGQINGNYVSDPLYLNQLGSPLALVDRTNIQSLAWLMYRGDSYSVRTQVDYWETIDPTIINNNQQPYFHLPQVSFHYGHSVLDTGLMFEGPVQLDSFDRTSSDPNTAQASAYYALRTTGQRLRLRPRLSYPLYWPSGYVLPSVTLQHNQYWLTNPEGWGTANFVQTNSNESFTVPIVSLDTGLFFDRDTEWGGTPLLHTLEPRIFYDYVPYVNQTNIPVFDSTQYDYTFYQMFRENRYAGSDRVGDTNQLTTALTSRLVDQTNGLERLRASVGMVFYFKERLVTLNNVTYFKTGSEAVYQDLFRAPTNQTQATSNLMADVGAGITEDWSFHAGGQWNPETTDIERGLIGLQYNNRQNQLLNVAYRYRVNQNTLECSQSIAKYDPYYPCLNLTDVSFRLPITAGWFAIGRWQYSILNQVTLESFAGIERESCCWRFAFLLRNYVNGFTTDKQPPEVNQPISSFGFFVQFEFKGLTNVNNDVDQFLARSISGYRYRNFY